MSDPRRPGPPPPPPSYPSFEERAYGTSPQRPAPPSLQVPSHHGHHHDGGPPQRRRRRKRRFGFGSFLLLLLFGLIAIGAAAAVFLITNPPTDLIRAQLIDQVKTRTGRTLTVSGPTQFTIIPSLGLSMKNVTLSPPPGMQGPAFAQMVGLDVSVRLLPLLKREVAIKRLVLQQPVINFRVDKQGRKSWDFAHHNARKPRVRLAQAGGTASDAPGGLPADAQEFLRNSSPGQQAPNPAGSGQSQTTINELQLGDVRIVNGTLRYQDARNGTKQHLDAVNVQLGLDHIRAPLDAKGNVRWRQQKVNFSGKLTSLNEVLNKKPAKLIVRLNSQPMSGRYDGSLHVTDDIAVKGAVAMSSPSLRQLAGWLGTSLPPARGYGATQVSGLLDSKGTIHRLSSAKIELDNQLAKGNVSVTTGRARPYVKAKLTLSQLDLNNYMGDGTAPPAAKRAAPAAPAAAPANSNQKPQSIEDLLGGASGTRVRGYTQRSGWSRAPINAAALGSVDADADLTIGRLFVNKLKVGRSDITVKLKNKVLKTTLKDMNFYSGRGRGVVTADGRRNKSISLATNLKLNGVDAQSLLKDLSNEGRFYGKGNISLAVTGSGASQHQIMNTLNGNADLRFNDGAIVGINIAKLIRNVSQGNFTNLSGARDEKTDFSSLSSTWSIQKGIARNQDLVLVGPLIRVTGQGAVMLGAQQLDYRVRPKLVANLQGQGGANSGTGLEIPVRIKGPWADPSIQPEVGDILASPDKAIDTVKKIGEQFKGKNTKEILDGLLGGGSDGSGKKSNPAGDLLDRFLR